MTELEEMANLGRSAAGRDGAGPGLPLPLTHSHEPEALISDEITFRFGRFSLSPARRMLSCDGQPLALGGRALDILAFLVAHAGKVVSKERLMAEVWASYAVEPNNLTVQMSMLRRVLGHDELGRFFIQTLPRRGYMFAAPVGRGDIKRPAPRPPISAPATSFVGRGQELTALGTLLQTHRLLTVVGIGGVGKTRLVQRFVAETAADECGFAWNKVVQCDLAPVADPAHIADAVATSLAVGSGLPTSEAVIVALLRAAPVLLVLDNAEQLVKAAGQLLRHLLAECPALTILVTSRVSLGVPGEAVLRLSPLQVPDVTATLTAEAALTFEAVRLFADRAATQSPGFRLDDGTAPLVAEICKRLDGLALAIEMVVPRLQILAPQQILERLHQRFDMLSAQGREPRQGSLRAMFDWSWKLLQPVERQLLRHMAAFAGSASLSALVEFEAPEGLSQWDVLDGLTRLVELSLVIMQPGSPEPRYRLLESTRFHALEELHPREEHELRSRHAVVT